MEGYTKSGSSVYRVLQWQEEEATARGVVE